MNRYRHRLKRLHTCRIARQAVHQVLHVIALKSLQQTLTKKNSRSGSGVNESVCKFGKNATRLREALTRARHRGRRRLDLQSQQVVTIATLFLLLTPLALCQASKGISGCEKLPDYSKLKSALQAAVKEGKTANSGMAGSVLESRVVPFTK